MKGSDLTLLGAIKHEMHWRRELSRILGQRTIWPTNRIVHGYLRTAAKAAILQIRYYREWIAILDSGEGAISENQKRAMRAYAVRHGKGWRFRLRDDWKAGRIGGDLKRFLDRWGPPMLAWCKLAYLDPFVPTQQIEKLQRPLAFH